MSILILNPVQEKCIPYSKCEMSKENLLYVGKEGETVFESSLTFDLADLPRNSVVIRATLQLFVKEAVSNGYQNIVHVYRSIPFSQESERHSVIQRSIIPQDSIEIDLSQQEYISWNITSYVHECCEKREEKLEVVLGQASKQKGLILFASAKEEDIKTTPLLVVEYI